MLRLPDDWLWDSWIADDGERYHLLFLKAPRALKDPALRHTAATIGHATSTDLTHWEVHGDALLPAANGWDDLAVWTGSVVRGEDSVWRASTTPRSRRNLGTASATSASAWLSPVDLATWRRIGDRPLLDPDSRW